jgi:hypothetical protein
VQVGQGQEPQGGHRQGRREGEGRREDLVLGAVATAQAEQYPGGRAARGEGQAGRDDHHVPAAGDVVVPHVPVPRHLPHPAAPQGQPDAVTGPERPGRLLGDHQPLQRAGAGEVQPAGLPGRARVGPLDHRRDGGQAVGALRGRCPGRARPRRRPGPQRRLRVRRVPRGHAGGRRQQDAQGQGARPAPSGGTGREDREVVGRGRSVAAVQRAERFQCRVELRVVRAPAPRLGQHPCAAVPERHADPAELLGPRGGRVGQAYAQVGHVAPRHVPAAQQRTDVQPVRVGGQPGGGPVRGQQARRRGRDADGRPGGLARGGPQRHGREDGGRPESGEAPPGSRPLGAADHFPGVRHAERLPGGARRPLVPDPAVFRTTTLPTAERAAGWHGSRRTGMRCGGSLTEAREGSTT